MADKLVLIMASGGHVSVDREPVYVSITGKEQVVWMSRDGDAFDVEFPGGKTPFSKSKFHADKGKSVRSGVASVTTGGKVYKYTVTVAGNTLDPTVRPTP